MIRPYQPGDDRAAAEVVRAVFHEYGFTFEDDGYNADLFDIQSHYIDVGSRFWVAENDGKIVGCVGVSFHDPLPGRPGEVTWFEGKKRAAGADCELHRLYVHPEARRMGLGAALFETTIQASLEVGKGWMEMWSDHKLTRAHRMYKGYGAVVIGERICDDPDESPEFGMILDLSKVELK